MPISHEWNGTILTITSDSGTSSCDLKGDKGDDGARGITTVISQCVAEDSNQLGGIPAEDYATKTYVDDALKEYEPGTGGGDIDLTNYATKTYVDDAIDNIQHPQPDLTGYATETYVEDYVEDALKDFEPSTGGDVDLSNYYTKAETTAAINAAKPNLSNYYTKTETNAAINAAKPDLSPYALKTEIPSTTKQNYTVRMDSTFVNTGNITAESVGGMLKVGGYIQTKKTHAASTQNNICYIDDISVDGLTYATVSDKDNTGLAYNILLLTEDNETRVQMEAGAKSLPANTWLNFTILGMVGG